jgi:hypothetical protein
MTKPLLQHARARTAAVYLNDFSLRRQTDDLFQDSASRWLPTLSLKRRTIVASTLPIPLAYPSCSGISSKES